MRVIKAHYKRNAEFYLGARGSILATFGLIIYLAWELKTA